MTIRVLLVGLGPIGSSVAKQIVARKGFQLVGAVDIDPKKIGRGAAEVIGLERPLNIPWSRFFGGEPVRAAH